MFCTTPKKRKKESISLFLFFAFENIYVWILFYTHRCCCLLLPISLCFWLIFGTLYLSIHPENRKKILRVTPMYVVWYVFRNNIAKSKIPVFVLLQQIQVGSVDSEGAENTFSAFVHGYVCSCQYSVWADCVHTDNFTYIKMYSWAFSDLYASFHLCRRFRPPSKMWFVQIISGFRIRMHENWINAIHRSQTTVE